MTAPRIVKQLVRRFEDNLDAYRSGHYNEAQVRLEYIDPFFKALGWDIHNEQGFAEAYKDVVHEDSIKVGGGHKAPDYSFRVGGIRKFFLEAKRPLVDIKGDPHLAYQLRRYAWSAKLPLSILTDFEEFAVYDCRIRPVQTDKASQARIMYLRFTEYLERWDELQGLFSKDAIHKGTFDRFVESSKKKRGTAEVDKAFLGEIEAWRDELARNIALRNGDVTQREVNFAVGRTIDRLIFLRICQDRGIEDYGQLQALLNGHNVYARLKQIYHKADDKYNSGLFHFRKEKDRAIDHDQLTLGLEIDDKVLKDIFRDLYYPDSPYVFSVLPADILGQVYEQFVGKDILLTAGHHAKVEDKPEVKKAGGVYYTPTYIVDYIVKHTVGKLLEKSTPRKAARLRILDPACGSGSFLLGAYQLLLDWHRDWYVEQRNRTGTTRRAPTKTSPIYQISGGDWRLTTAERKRILLNNIYGVDIDTQAVEVTKLALLLKVLEGESGETLQRVLDFHRERALPDLGSNIKCGNSLIGPDFYEGQNLELFDEEERHRINVFDWEAEFPEIINHKDAKKSGFDAVIGNPPYGALFTVEEKLHISAKYTSQTYQLDSYQLFLEKAITHLLRKDGFYGMIIPNPWLTNLLQKAIRCLVVNETRIVDIVHFRFSVFPKVTVDTLIVILQRSNPAKWKPTTMMVDAPSLMIRGGEEISGRTIRHSQKLWRQADGDVINIFMTTNEMALAQKCHIEAQGLDELCQINVGIKPYQIGKGKPPQTKNIVAERPYDSDYAIDKTYRPYLRGSDISRYQISPLESRYIKFGPWLAEPRPSANFDATVKLVIRQTGDSIVATIDTDQFLCLNNMHVIVPGEKSPSPSYLLGIIDSSLLNWYYHTLNPEVGEALAEVKKTNIARLPIKKIDSSNPADISCHDQMVSLVERMLALHKELAAARTEHDKTALQRQINATDRQIDKLVYELYGLTEEEIVVVEGLS